MTATILEWAAFSASLLSVWFYGRKGLWGPVAGVSTALLFFAFGLAAEVYAAIFANAVFFTLHVRNGLRIMQADETRQNRKITEAANMLVEAAHGASVAAGWWNGFTARPPYQTKVSVNPELLDRHVVPAKLCLIHSEVSEAMEGHRKGLMDDKLPHRPMIEVELADAVIRIADLAGALGLDLGGAIAEKMAFNRVRPDHKIENREKAGGKVY